MTEDVFFMRIGMIKFEKIAHIITKFQNRNAFNIFLLK